MARPMKWGENGGVGHERWGNAVIWGGGGGMPPENFLSFVLSEINSGAF